MNSNVYPSQNTNVGMLTTKKMIEFQFLLKAIVFKE